MAKGSNKSYTEEYIRRTLGKNIDGTPIQKPKVVPAVAPKIELESINISMIPETPKTIMVQPEPPKAAYEPVEAPKADYAPAETPEPEAEEPEEEEKPGLFQRVLNVFGLQKKEPIDDYEMPEDRKMKILEENSNETKLKKLLAEKEIKLPEEGMQISDFEEIVIEKEILPELKLYEEPKIEWDQPKVEPPKMSVTKKAVTKTPTLRKDSLEVYAKTIQNELGLTLEDITGKPYTVKEIDSNYQAYSLRKQKASIGDKIIDSDKRDVTRVIDYFDKRADKLRADFPDVDDEYGFYTKVLDDVINTDFEKEDQNGWYTIDELAMSAMNKKINKIRTIYAAMDKADKKIEDYEQKLSADAIKKKKDELSNLSEPEQAERIINYRETNLISLAGYKEIRKKMDNVIELYGYPDVNRAYKTLKNKQFTFESEYFKDFEDQKSSLLVLVSDLDELED
ncbi:MAG: hypothetical protein PHC66_02895 [Candidatus Nanoarchaeia archaeon]|nr:hypothetical protein [Candidatus Nanoarchaeia archaeon]MDD5239009.1 hypothetical protein [Candidatus Nanoarchaeia archaeon]